MLSRNLKRRKNYRTSLPRFAKRKKHITGRVGIWVICLLSGAGVVAISFFPLPLPNLSFSLITLPLKKIEIEGCVRYTPEQILAMAGIQPQVNLLSLNLSRICQLLENAPWIENAEVQRILPDQLEITITERIPQALINLPQLYLVDKKGTIFKKADREDGLSLPVLTGVSWEQLMKNQTLYTSLIQQALMLITACNDEGIDSAAISEIHLDAVQGLTLFTAHPPVQITAGFSPFREKCRRLRSILYDLEQKNLLPLTIDLTYRKKAFVRVIPRFNTTKPIKKGGEHQWENMEI